MLHEYGDAWFAQKIVATAAACTGAVGWLGVKRRGEGEGKEGIRVRGGDASEWGKRHGGVTA